MRILDKYLAKTVLAAIALVTLMLIGLQIFILFVNQMGDLGKGDYGFFEAAFFVLLQLPYQVYLFFPMASLLGSLIGLGMLANTSELIVMRASGLSIGQITFAVFKAALILIIPMTLMGETLVPHLAHKAQEMKLSAISGGQSLKTAKGLWIRQDKDYINIGEIAPNFVLKNVYQFHFDKNSNLGFARFIGELHYEDKSWKAYDLAETTFTIEKTQANFYKEKPWELALNPQILEAMNVEPDEMTLKDLYHYLTIQKGNNTQNYALSFWQRIMQPFTTLVMMLLAIPFIFGPLRQSTMGVKLLTGVTVGFGFHIFNKFFGPVSFVFQWPAFIAALAPTLIFALLGLYLMRKMR